MPTSAEIQADVSEALDGMGIDTAMAESLLAAADQAGYALVPLEGGDPVAISDTAAVVRLRLTGGVRGYLCECERGGVTVRWLEFIGKGGEIEQRLAIGATIDPA